MSDKELIRYRFAQMSDEELVRTVRYEEHEMTEESRLLLQEEIVKRRLDTSLLESIVQNRDSHQEQKVARAKRSAEEAFAESVWTYALTAKHQGVADDEILTGIQEMGLDREHAIMIVKSLATKASEGIKAANSDMTWGGLICLGGLLITIWTYMDAQGGGTYVVAWGAILFGAIRLFRGMSQSTRFNVILRNIMAEQETEAVKEQDENDG